MKSVIVNFKEKSYYIDYTITSSYNYNIIVLLHINYPELLDYCPPFHLVTVGKDEVINLNPLNLSSTYEMFEITNAALSNIIDIDPLPRIAC